MRANRQLLIFDLDGVLIDSQSMHQETLIESIFAYDKDFILDDRSNNIIGMSIPTKIKLAKMNFSVDQIDLISSHKQKLTEKAIEKIKQDKRLVRLFRKLSNKYYIAVASNSHSKTVSKTIDKLGIARYISLYLGNDQVINPKPSPEIYIACMNYFKLLPSQTIIFEDSPEGIMAGQLSGAKVIVIKNSKHLKNKLRRYLVFR